MLVLFALALIVPNANAQLIASQTLGVTVNVNISSYITLSSMLAVNG